MMLARNWRLLNVVFLGGAALCLATHVAQAQEPSEKVPDAKPQTVSPNPELKQRPPITQE